MTPSPTIASVTAATATIDLPVAVGAPAATITARPPGRRGWRVARWALAIVVSILLAGNLAIFGLSLVAGATIDAAPVAIHGVAKARVVDDRVVRGAAPTRDGYRGLAALGVTTVVDLRAEDDLVVPETLLRDLGITRVHLPIRDGQTPTAEEVQQFLTAVRESPGRVFVHCGAGVGRTGAMVAAYLVATGEASGVDALAGNLAVGPPSLEQMVYAASLEDGSPNQPPALVKALSRVLDGPRRLWSRYGL